MTRLVGHTDTAGAGCVACGHTFGTPHDPLCSRLPLYDDRTRDTLYFALCAAEKKLAEVREERDEWKRRALPTPLTPERDQDVRGWIARMWDQNAEGRGYARDLLGLVEYGAKQLADVRTELSEWQKRAAQAQAMARALLDADIDRGEREARVEQALAAYAGVKEERDRAVARAQVLELALKNRRRAALKEAAEICRNGTAFGRPGSSWRLDCAEEIDERADEPAPEVE